MPLFDTGDPVILAAIRDGVKEAILDPRFNRALLLDIAARFVWVTLDEAAELVGKDVRTIRRWATNNKLTVTTAFGDRQKRYRLGDVEAAAHKKKAMPVRKTNGAGHATPARHEATSLEPARREKRRPSGAPVALRDVQIG